MSTAAPAVRKGYRDSGRTGCRHFQRPLLVLTVFVQLILALSGDAFAPSLSAMANGRPSTSRWLASQPGNFVGATNDTASVESVAPPNTVSVESTRVRTGPFPIMPSKLFLGLAQSQFELLQNSLVHVETGRSKVASMVLYLPKENEDTGQLQFVPAISYPSSSPERVFIASKQSSTGRHKPPTLPSRAIPSLPGFFDASQVIPSYPFISSSPGDEEQDTAGSREDAIGVSAVEEIPLSNAVGVGVGLSVTLFLGLETLGTLVVWPQFDETSQWSWNANDNQQIQRAAKSLALALSMDTERATSQLANERFRVLMSDQLHQVKSPLQALRTYGKLLQRQLAEDPDAAAVLIDRISPNNSQNREAMRLAEEMISQNERVVDLIEPLDDLVNHHGRASQLLLGVGTERSPLLLKSSDETDFASGSELRQYHFETVYPQDVLGPLIYTYQAICREQGIHFVAAGFEPENNCPGVTVSTKHLQEALSNLLDNAIKYVRCRPRARGRPRIPRIKCTLLPNEHRDGATLYVEDNGPGIPTIDAEKVFVRGYRGDNVKLLVEGNGLGLGIAREMIEDMNGTLQILPVGPNKMGGATIQITLLC
ncbi:hypothetical protein THAOC_09483 [Thalassiosira oceanica]|uniref:histidine kinase n=1 Tax=Thalassiosira oceanica TaxID=159749 RepID=K0TFI5_THAOC|nr:hypothetical protein THAOC_09483 [Thalassiosira oceanica]|eukprot:EJK69272.1 hypothetical protein THAOC_09483 [Thalassiosira oceanica]